MRQKGLYAQFIKRPQDVLLSLLAMIVLSPVFIIVTILAKIFLGSPVIFKQKRPGWNEKIFTLYKFRTMTNKRDETGKLLPDEARLTRFGKFLRSTSLDELPELWNILRGDMSIVGPRPLLVKDLVFMTRKQRIRHSVMPGLTGLAQINGRNCILWEDKFSYDINYIKNISFRNDWKIIFMTFISVFKRDGVSTEGMATAEDLGDYLLRIGKISEDYYRETMENCNVNVR